MNEMLANLTQRHAAGIVEEHNLLARLEEIRRQRTQQEGAIMALRELARQDAAMPRTDNAPTD